MLTAIKINEIAEVLRIEICLKNEQIGKVCQRNRRNKRQRTAVLQEGDSPEKILARV